VQFISPMDYPIGLDLDYSNDKEWTLIISYENLEELSFEIETLAIFSFHGKNLKDDITQSGVISVIIKLEEVGQDGTVFFRKFSIRPKDSLVEDSLIDTLKFYEKKYYNIKLAFKGNKDFYTG
ncbi:hypothetical protein PMAYCL1PPCAC_19418, partial [Pristionchus mayeri]